MQELMQGNIGESQLVADEEGSLGKMCFEEIQKSISSRITGGGRRVRMVDI